MLVSSFLTLCPTNTTNPPGWQLKLHRGQLENAKPVICVWMWGTFTHKLFNIDSTSFFISFYSNLLSFSFFDLKKKHGDISQDSKSNCFKFVLFCFCSLPFFFFSSLSTSYCKWRFLQSIHFAQSQWNVFRGRSARWRTKRPDTTAPEVNTTRLGQGTVSQ